MEFWVILIKFTETCKYGHLCQPIFLVFRYERQTGAIWTTIIWNVNNLTRKTFPHFRHNDRIDQKILKVKQSCNASFKQTTLPKNKKNPPIDSCHSKMHTAGCFWALQLLLLKCAWAPASESLICLYFCTSTVLGHTLWQFGRTCLLIRYFHSGIWNLFISLAFRFQKNTFSS